MMGRAPLQKLADKAGASSDGQNTDDAEKSSGSKSAKESAADVWVHEVAASSASNRVPAAI